MMHLDKKQNHYFSIDRFWEPVIKVSPILQPWKNKIYHNSASHPVAVFALHEFFKQAIETEGSVAEFGVWRGGTAVVLAEELKSQKLKKKFYLFDTFCGIPKISTHDNFWKVGDFKNVNFDELKSVLAKYDFVSVHKGEFCETIQNLENERFCFVHIDSDTYESVGQITEFIFPKMNKGGIIVYDDYGDFVSQGVKKAVDKYYKNINKNIIYLPSKQAVVLF